VAVRVERAGPYSVWGTVVSGGAAGDGRLTAAPAVPRL